MTKHDPVDRNRLERRLRARRDARREALRLNAVARARIERELIELDDAVVGLDHMQAEQLRAWSERLDAHEMAPGQSLDHGLEDTFPASDVPAQLAPGSQA